MSNRTYHLCAFAGAFLLIVSFFLILPKQSVAQIHSESDFRFVPIIGEIKWGHVFHKSLNQDLIFTLELLGGESEQIGVYISIMNKKNPKNYRFVILNEIENAHESNFIGILVPGGIKPDWHAEYENLNTVIEQNRNAGLKITFFTDNLNERELNRVFEAGLELKHHGLDERQYAQAREVLDELHQAIGIFRILDYKIAENPLRIESLKFSFDP